MVIPDRIIPKPNCATDSAFSKDQARSLDGAYSKPESTGHQPVLVHLAIEALLEQAKEA
jgi:hypothetical protein